ncbi:MAG TPA: hypothetical protein PLS58_02985 [Bacteroidales bacterium]|nr:hypothetical protein [Bacteroidales bacterium]
MKRREFINKAALGSIALPLFSPDFNIESKGKSDIKVGFSTVDLRDCIISDTGYRYPLEAKCMVLEEGKLNVLLYALDFGEVHLGFCEDVQAKIGRTFNISPESILLHTTHTHSGPWDHGQGERMIDATKLVELLTQTANNAFSNAKPAKLKIGEENVGKRLSVHRRGDTNTGMGIQTYWFGYEYNEGDDRPEASALINEMSSRWMGKLGNYKSCEEKVYFDREVDPWVQVMYFVDLKDKPLGSIVRFSAHPHQASFFRESMWDPDFPGRTRNYLEKELGGHCLFLQGGSGNLVPKERVKYQLWDDYKFNEVYLGPLSEFHAIDENELLADIDRIGKEIASAAITALQRAHFTRLNGFRYKFSIFDVPLDPSLPASAEEIEVIRKALTREYYNFLAANGDLSELRRLANVLNWLDWGAYYALGLITQTDRINGFKPAPYSVLRLNETPIVFMNSEVSVETSLALREQFKTQKPWIVSLTGGTLSYMPTDKMIDEGGYEGRNTLIAKGTEPKVRRHITEMLTKS